MVSCSRCKSHNISVRPLRPLRDVCGLMSDDSFCCEKEMEISPEELLCRKDTLKRFEHYIHSATKTLENLTQKVGWSLDKTPTDDSLSKCTLKSKQKMPPNGNHPKILEWNGYESLYSIYCSSSSSVKNDMKHEPQKYSQSTVDYTKDFSHLTADERKELYDSVVRKNPNPDPDNASKNLVLLDSFNETKEKPKTELELMQEQRDSKRRRAAYRGKRVHTDRKSYVEVLREVVEGLTKSVSHQEDKSVCVETANNNNNSVSDNRCVYKYEGNQNFDGHPYTRWIDIKTEEYNLFKYYEEKAGSPHEEPNTSRIQHSDDNVDTKISRRSRSDSKSRRRSSSGFKLKKSKRSRSRSTYKEIKYKKSKRSRTPIESNEIKSIRPKTRSKSKKTMSRKSRSRSISIEKKHKKLKRHKTRSNSNECSSSKKTKHSESPLNFSSSLSNEKVTDKLKSGGDRKKKKKHKNKKKRSKSPKRSNESKKK